ncbi:hypothetical protein [Thalassobacillus devorans]|uniref:hypothetical protein n=1 Tax=Thalassobacillus devorans TaxID=279813 RepID=UPI000A1C987B|nr:hypothetical protein [Thalassobacillus devorans]
MNKNWDTLPINFKARLTGKLLGDGGITIQSGRQPRFQFIHRLTDREWSFYCYDKLNPVLPLSPPKYRKVKDGRLKKGYSESVQCQSRTSPLINFLEEKWYKSRKKQIPFDLIEESMNNECLAWWYQDDGHLKIESNQPVKIILSTDSFTEKENLLLIEVLHQKLNLKFSMDKKNRLALYDRSSIIYFLYLVNSYVNPCMIRKTWINELIYYELPANRTTLYLPNSYHPQKPTMDINHLLNNLEKLWHICEKGQFFCGIYEPYLNKFTLTQYQRCDYQIVIYSNNMSYLYSLKKYTGLTYSQLAHLCLLIEKGPQ